MTVSVRPLYWISVILDVRYLGSAPDAPRSESPLSPPLLSEPFTAGKLEDQLEKLARGFVNSDRGVRLSADGNTAELSQIFEWYKDDFKGGGVLEFINKRRAKPLPEDVKISYRKYDWSLNETK